MLGSIWVLAQDIVVKRTLEKKRNQRVAGNLYHRHLTLKYEIENFKDQPVKLKIAEQIAQLRQEFGAHSGQSPAWEIGEDTTFKGGLVADETHQGQVTFTADLPARDGDEAEKVTLYLHLVFKNQW